MLLGLYIILSKLTTIIQKNETITENAFSTEQNLLTLSSRSYVRTNKLIIPKK